MVFFHPSLRPPARPSVRPSVASLYLQPVSCAMKPRRGRFQTRHTTVPGAFTLTPAPCCSSDPTHPSAFPGWATHSAKSDHPRYTRHDRSVQAMIGGATPYILMVLANLHPSFILSTPASV